MPFGLDVYAMVRPIKSHLIQGQSKLISLFTQRHYASDEASSRIDDPPR